MACTVVDSFQIPAHTCRMQRVTIGPSLFAAASWAAAYYADDVSCVAERQLMTRVLVQFQVGSRDEVA
jgi:hypothetical protein